MPTRTPNLPRLLVGSDLAVEEAVERAFPSDQIARLAFKVARLPKAINLSGFSELLRAAAFFYIEEKREGSPQLARAQLEKLAQRARLPQVDGEELAARLRSLSPLARQTLEFRSRNIKTAIPTDEEVRSPQRSDLARQAILRLTTYGVGRDEDGRLRKSGRRSIAFPPMIFAPTGIGNAKDRTVEYRFVDRLRVAWAAAEPDEIILPRPGLPPAFKTSPKGTPTQFAELVQACFDALGARMNAVEIINRQQKNVRCQGAKRNDENG